MRIFLKIKYLYFSFVGALKEEGVVKSSNRIANYLLHGKGVLDFKKEISIKEDYLPLSEATIEFQKKINEVPNDIDEAILYFDHELGGGANRYREGYINNGLLKGKKIAVVSYVFSKSIFHLKYYEGEKVSRYKFKNFPELLPIIEMIRINKIVISGIVSYEKPLWILGQIKTIKEIYNCKLEILVHDYFCVCPNFTLVDHTGKYCDLPEDEYCKMCMSKNQGDFRLVVRNKDVIKWRKSWLEILSLSDNIICFSESSKHIIRRIYSEIDENKIVIIPHEVDYIMPIEKINHSDGHVLTIGILGGISFIKGLAVIKEIARIIEEGKKNVKIVIIGEVIGNIDSRNVVVLGRYKRSEIQEITQKNEIDVFFIPSICPETFSYTTEEIIQMGMPVAVFNLGAPAERVAKYEKGLIISKVDAQEALDSIIEFHKNEYYIM